ncbi:hypothetical protein VNO77_27793 [Canavalia gladiata]|uniref:Peptidase A1 domain-containing protein n=1 Tax=Canavalia gladiata TaxID=3824 RepID=A0AAN9KXJ3_CANGL
MRIFVLWLFVQCSFCTTPFTEATKIPIGFSIDLIHRDSPLSPFYNPSMTHSELIKNAAIRSISKSNHVSQFMKGNKSSNTITIPAPDLGEYLMRFYIGTPPVERFAIADTGSDLIWVQCSPCKKCTPQKSPLFDPKKSSSFRKVPCDSQPCTLLSQSQRRCGKSGKCEYLYQYGDNSYTIGNLGVESIGFGFQGRSQIGTFHKFTFGCGHNNNDTAAQTIMPKNTGLVGLGAGPLSLVSQLGDQIGHKFSYCLLPLSSNSPSKLKFGNEAMLGAKGVVSTPLIIKSSVITYYYLNLEGIAVGKKMVKMDKDQTDGNIIIDSGTTFTVLEQSFYNKFITLVKQVYGVEAEKNPPMPYDFCFRLKDDDENLPDIAFQFTGAKVVLNPINLFSLFDNNILCMLIQPTSGISTFGNQAQVGFEVEYDLEGEKVSFAHADCTKN